jgi:hypothetical protein
VTNQFRAILAASTAAGAANTQTPAATGSAPAQTTDGPPIISVNGENPATIRVGDRYADLGTITSPQADLNLGITTLLDGATTTQLTPDTGVPGTHTIEYRVFDQSGLMGSASRTVIVSSPANDNASLTTDASSTLPPANDNPPPADVQATGTDSTTTAQ